MRKVPLAAAVGVDVLMMHLMHRYGGGCGAVAGWEGKTNTGPSIPVAAVACALDEGAG
jgi:hypothetical protein